MKLADLMKGDGKAIKVQDGEIYEFLINEEHTIRYRSFDKSPYFYLYAKIKELSPDQVTKPFLSSLLEYNVFSNGTSNTYFAWHQETGSLLLMATFDSESTTEADLKRGLENFISHLVHWKKKFEESVEKVQGEDVLSLLSQKQKIVFA